MKKKLHHYYELFKKIFNRLFPTTLACIDFMGVWFFSVVMIHSVQNHYLTRTLVSVLGLIYCLHEWDKAIEKSHSD